MEQYKQEFIEFMPYAGSRHLECVAKLDFTASKAFSVKYLLIVTYRKIWDFGVKMV